MRPAGCDNAVVEEIARGKHEQLVVMMLAQLASKSHVDWSCTDGSGYADEQMTEHDSMMLGLRPCCQDAPTHLKANTTNIAMCFHVLSSILSTVSFEPISSPTHTSVAEP